MTTPGSGRRARGAGRLAVVHRETPFDEPSVPDTARSQLSPHHARRVTLPARFGPLAGLRTDGPADRLVMMLPGFTSGKEDFVPLLDPLAEAGLPALAVDLPGQHESAGPPEEADYHPVRLGALIAELISELAADGTRIVLLGHSFGGLVARGAVLAGAPVAGLTLLCSGPSQIPAGPRRDLMEHGTEVLREHGPEAAWAVRERAADAGAWRALPEQLRELFRDRFLNSSPAGLAGMADGARFEPDLVSQLLGALRRAHAPCLVVCGADDDVWSAAAQRDMAQRLDADYAVVGGSGHSPNTENPDELLATLIPTWRVWLS